MLLLRSYRNWDFPKGTMEPSETPLDAAIRETAEESSITDLAFRWGEVFCETAPYRHGKIARYYLAETTRNAITLPISPELGIPEHHEWRWVSFDQAKKLWAAAAAPAAHSGQGEKAASGMRAAFIVGRFPYSAVMLPLDLVVGVTGQLKFQKLLTAASVRSSALCEASHKADYAQSLIM